MSQVIEVLTGEMNRVAAIYQEKMAEVEELARLHAALLEAVNSVRESQPEKKRQSKADRYAQFRDWVVRESDHELGFTKEDVRNGLGLTVVDYLIKNGLQKQIIKQIGVVSTGKKGRQPHLYRYVKRVEESPLVPTTNGSKPVAAVGSGPVAISTTRVPKEVMDVVRPALKAGASLSRTGSGHFKLEEPGKQPIIIASTPSDKRARKNIRAQMRRHSYKVT